MTKSTQSGAAQVSSEQRGYWGVVIAVLCATIISSLGLFQSLKLHQTFLLAFDHLSQTTDVYF